ncbi:MAG: hypothetical protein MRZ79_08865 [Bacteroidia bacterium]|nr:hypothetical protein [Bacteroidia bacterium]
MKFISFLFLGSLLFLFSCEIIEDPGKVKVPDWNPAFATAVINTEISLQDMLDLSGSEDIFEVDSSGALSFVYEGNLIDPQSFSFFSIPDFTVPMLVPAIDFPFPIEGIEEILFQQGSMEMIFESPVSEEIVVDIDLPNFLLNGNPYQESLNFIGAGEHRFTIQLSDMAFILNNGNMRLAYKAYRTSDSSSLVLDNFRFEAAFMEYSYVKGGLEKQEITLAEDSLEFSFGEELKGLDFSLAAPDLTFTVRNSFGIPLEFRVDQLSVYQEGEAAIEIQTQELEDGILLNYPSEEERGSTKATEIKINGENSNIGQAISMIPDGVIWSMDIVSFPDSLVDQGFLLDTSNISVDLHAKMPLKGSLGELDFAQTVPLEIDEVDMLNAAGLRLLVENEIPLNVAIQIYLLDEFEDVQDSLFEGYTTLLEGAPVDESGRVTGPASSLLDIEVDAEKLQKLYEISYLRIGGKLSTTGMGSQSVQLSATGKISFKMGIRGEALVED